MAFIEVTQEWGKFRNNMIWEKGEQPREEKPSKNGTKNRRQKKIKVKEEENVKKDKTAGSNTGTRNRER